ncbi:hypothetical protein MRX96_003976 [Rhipicephalus microplus]
MPVQGTTPNSGSGTSAPFAGRFATHTAARISRLPDLSRRCRNDGTPAECGAAQLIASLYLLSSRQKRFSAQKRRSTVNFHDS